MFKKLAPETEKAHLATMERLNGSTTSWLEEADWSLPGWQRYSGHKIKCPHFAHQRSGKYQ